MLHLPLTHQPTALLPNTSGLFPYTVTHTHTHTRTQSHTHAHTQSHTHTHTQSHTHTHTHTHSHTHTHKQMHTPQQTTRVHRLHNNYKCQAKFRQLHTDTHVYMLNMLDDQKLTVSQTRRQGAVDVPRAQLCM